MIIDSHQHFWKYDARQYPWIPKGSPLQRDWLPADWQEEAQHVGVGGSIAVQARQTLEESRWLLQLADENPNIKGVVGWVDLRSENVGAQLAEFSRHPKLVGVRPDVYLRTCVEAHLAGTQIPLPHELVESPPAKS